MKSLAVLLVEDDENDVLLFQMACTKADLTNPLHVLTDGQKALDYLSGAGEWADRSAHPLPDLLLLDLNLPYQTGFEVLKWIREHPTLRTLPVVVLTSSSAESDVQRAYTLGANSYLIKPSAPEKLRELVNLLKLYWMDWNLPPPLHGRKGE